MQVRLVVNRLTYGNKVHVKPIAAVCVGQVVDVEDVTGVGAGQSKSLICLWFVKVAAAAQI